MQIIMTILTVLTLVSVIGMVAADAYADPSASNRVQLAAVVLSLGVTLGIVAAFH
jgi:hypothetical protein